MLQVRLTRHYPDRVRAGAPVPARSLTDAELVHNLRHFTVHQQGPRTRPCTALVISGASLPEHPSLASILAQARQWGVQRITLHLGRGQRAALVGSPLQERVDAVAMGVSTPEDAHDVEFLARTSLFVSAAVVLSDDHLARLPELARSLARARPQRVVLTWPLPPAQPPPPAQRVVAALPEAMAILDAAGIQVGIKGLPVCALGDLGDRLWRSGNRWYVDAEHQGDEALLFFPDVLRFSKVEDCRFCRADLRCDGVPDRWLALGLAGRLEAV